MRSPSEQISEGQPGATEPIVEPDAEVMQRHPRRQSSSQTSDLVGPLPPQAEGVKQLVVDRLYDLTNAGDPSPQALGPGLLGVALGRMDDLGSVAFQPTPMIVFSLEAFVCDVGSREGRARAFEPRVGISPQREEGLGQWLIGGGGTPETEARYYPGGLYSGQEREALVPPYGVGPTDVGLPGEPAVTPTLGVPDGHRRTIECLVGMSLTLQHLPQLQGDLLDVLGIQSQETVELGTVWESRECPSEMGLGVAVEVSFVVVRRPPREDGEGDDFALGEGGWRSGASLFGGVRLAEIIHDDVEYGEEGVHIEHVESAPFPSGLVGKPTLIRGHLPLKSSPCNSHQAFKAGADAVLHKVASPA